jgi:bacterioferritin-associated ferredoxin
MYVCVCVCVFSKTIIVLKATLDKGIGTNLKQIELELDLSSY